MIWVITMVTPLITPLMTTHERSSNHEYSIQDLCSGTDAEAPGTTEIAKETPKLKQYS